LDIPRYSGISHYVVHFDGETVIIDNELILIGTFTLKIISIDGYGMEADNLSGIHIWVVKGRFDRIRGNLYPVLNDDLFSRKFNCFMNVLQLGSLMGENFDIQLFKQNIIAMADHIHDYKIGTFKTRDYFFPDLIIFFNILGSKNMNIWQQNMLSNITNKILLLITQENIDTSLYFNFIEKRVDNFIYKYVCFNYRLDTNQYIQFDHLPFGRIMVELETITTVEDIIHKYNNGTST